MDMRFGYVVTQVWGLNILNSHIILAFRISGHLPNPFDNTFEINSVLLSTYDC